MTSYHNLVKRGERVVSRQVNSLDDVSWKAWRAIGRLETTVRRAWSTITSWQKP